MEYKFLTADIVSLSDLRNRYAELMSDLQTRSSLALMDQVSAEYRMKFEELRARDTDPAAADQSRAADYDVAADRRIQEKNEETMAIKGVTMECIGSWLWLPDNDATKEHAAELESLGYKLSKRRKRWYFTPKQKTERRYRGRKSFDEIRETF